MAVLLLMVFELKAWQEYDGNFCCRYQLTPYVSSFPPHSLHISGIEDIRYVCRLPWYIRLIISGSI